MVVQFANINQHERPILILKRADDTPIGVLGNATEVEFEPKYNEVSILSFRLPAMVNGEPTPYYDDVTGQKVIELKGIGQFVVRKPTETGDKITRCLEVTAESLECEFARKKITLPEYTYKFFDNTNPDGTALGMIMELMPNWKVGSVAQTLVNKYRTYDVSNENLYNFIKGDVQQAYNCIFDFDTLNRRVNVRDADAVPSQKQVYISRDNLAKDISVTENPDDLVTRLDVNGADGVNIREVNPTGDNVIINLDYYMTTENFTAALVTKYNAWKTLVSDNKLPFYNYAIQYAMLVAEEAAENAKLEDLRGEYTSLENIQAVTIQSIAQGLMTQSDLDTANANLRAKKTEITAKKTEIATITAEKEDTMAAMKQIRDACAFASYFTEEERKAMDPYIIDNSVSENTFVASEVQSYTDGNGNRIQNGTIIVSGAEITPTTSAGGSTLYAITGGTVSAADIVTADIIRGVIERRSSGKIVISLYLSKGTYDEAEFPSACVSVSGSGSVTSSGGSATCTLTDAYLYFTLNATDYEKKTVAWELYEYGETLLRKMSVPSYTFSVDSANFIALEEFEHFKNQLELGQRIYIEVKGGEILQPICTRAKITWDDLKDLELMFTDTYTAGDGQSKLIEILDESISMGKTLSAGKFTYEAWTNSGASTSIQQFMNSALDTAKNAILSSSDQAVSWDGAGLRLRKYAGASRDAYENEQIWLNNNSILMTDDGWTTAKMAIGKFTDDNLGDKWGIIAPMIVGTLLAGEELVIESQKKDGGTAVFKVDEDGCRLYNASFAVQRTDATTGDTTQILLNPDIGLAIGTYPLMDQDDELDTDNATFYVTPAGNVVANDLSIYGGGITMHGFKLTNEEMSIDSDFTIKAGGKLALGSAGQLESTGILIDGSDVQIKAGGTLDILSGGNLNIKSNSNLTIESGGKLTVAADSLYFTSTATAASEIGAANTAASNAASAASAAQTTANSAASAASAAQTTANNASTGVTNITNGTTAVKKVTATGMTIDGNAIGITSTGVLTVAANAAVYFKNASGQNAITMNNGGITIASGGSITLAATQNLIISSGKLTIDASGNATFSGALSAATGTFSGSLSAATGTFSGSLSAATGSFEGTINAGSGNFVVDGSGNVTCKNLTMTGGKLGNLTMGDDGWIGISGSTTNDHAWLNFGMGAVSGSFNDGNMFLMVGGDHVSSMWGGISRGGELYCSDIKCWNQNTGAWQSLRPWS